MADVKIKDEVYWKNLEEECDNLDFNAIGKMMCGLELTEEDRATVDKFNALYDEVHVLKASVS